MVRRDEICQDVERTAIYRFLIGSWILSVYKISFSMCQIRFSIMRFCNIIFPQYDTHILSAYIWDHQRLFMVDLWVKNIYKIPYLQGYPPFFADYGNPRNRKHYVPVILSWWASRYFYRQPIRHAISPVISSTLWSALDPPPKKRDPLSHLWNMSQKSFMSTARHSLRLILPAIRFLAHSTIKNSRIKNQNTSDHYTQTPPYAL